MLLVTYYSSLAGHNNVNRFLNIEVTVSEDKDKDKEEEEGNDGEFVGVPDLLSAYSCIY